MSKNFELLQKIGNWGELSDPSGTPERDVSGIDADRELQLAKATRDRVLERASLPNVLNNEPDSRSLSGCEADARIGENGNGSHGAPSRGAVRRRVIDGGTEFHHSKNASNGIDIALPLDSPQEIAGNERGSHQRLDLIETASALGPAASLPDVIPEPSSGEVKSSRQARRDSFASRWADSVRRAAKESGRESRPRGRAHRVDTETISREEEIKLVQRVFPEGGQDSPRMALFSCLEGESGCAAICARTAEILAARGEGPVCVVDANFLSPSLHRYFGVENARGLTEATFELGPIHEFVQQIPEPDLWLLPSGKTSAELSFPAIADGLRVRISELRDAFRYVVIHAGVLRLETSAMLMSRWTDGVVLILEANSTSRDSAKRAKEILRGANVNLLGIVLNNRTFPIPEAIYRRI